jgi:hypothetical protein
MKNIVIKLKDESLVSEWRAAVKTLRENGDPVDELIQLGVMLADLFQIPDDVPLVDAVCQAVNEGRKYDHGHALMVN